MSITNNFQNRADGTDYVITLDTGTTVEFGPRKDDGEGGMTACLDAKAQVWGIYIRYAHVGTAEWVGDASTQMWAAAMADGLRRILDWTAVEA